MPEVRMPTAKPSTTPRRTMQQIKHCVEEALASYEADEDPMHAISDLYQARELIDVVVGAIKNGNRFV